MIVTLSGSPGSGKSSVAKMLATQLSMERYSSGDFLRTMAKERGMQLIDLLHLAEKDPSIDQEADARQKKFGQEKDNFVIDGRLSFLFIPHSVKIFLGANPLVRAKRILKDINEGNRSEEQASCLEDVEKEILEREESERLRYEKYYHINPYDTAHYDLVVDTSDLTIGQVVGKIIHYIEQLKSSQL